MKKLMVVLFAAFHRELAKYDRSNDNKLMPNVPVS
jgi:hypothetical protein